MKATTLLTTLVLYPGAALGDFLSLFQFPDGSDPRCVPFLIDQQDSGSDICLTSIDGLLKKVTIEFPNRPDYQYQKVYVDWGCSVPTGRSPTLFPYQSPFTGCSISSNKHYAKCEIYTALYRCSGCNEQPTIVAYADMKRVSDGLKQIGSGLGKCIEDVGGNCPKQLMWWQVKLLCKSGNQKVTSRTSNLLTATAQPTNVVLGEGAQCSGRGWTGSTVCQTGYTCKALNSTHSFCTYSGNSVQIQSGQCGGDGWFGMTNCGDEQECYAWKPDFFVCRSTRVCDGRGSQCGGSNNDDSLWWGPRKCPANHECHRRNDTFHGCRSSDVQTAGGQCDGIDADTGDFWWGPHTCPDNHDCREVAANVSQCVRIDSATSTLPAAPPPIQTVGGQCGGIAWTGPATCDANSQCRKFTDRWHECRPSDEVGRQCGGIGWLGDISCPAGQACRKFTDWWYQCVDDGDGSGRQCGGQGYKGDTSCPIGFYCHSYTDWWSECVSTNVTELQCGGMGWTGDTACPTGYVCRKFTDLYFQCVPAGNAALQCGGMDWTGDTTCPDGYTCNKFTDYYSQCIANADLASYQFGNGLATTEPYVMLCTAQP